jgi:hypothetical protein
MAQTGVRATGSRLTPSSWTTTALKPDGHRDRSLFAPWARYELVARNIGGDELARARGYGTRSHYDWPAGFLSTAYVNAVYITPMV